MNRALILFLSTFAVAFGASAQQHASGISSGFGSVANPGTGHQGGVVAGSRIGNRPYTGTTLHRNRSPYGLPVYGGYFPAYGYGLNPYGINPYGYAQDASQEQSQTPQVIVNVPSSAAPPVIINQYFGTQDAAEPSNLHVYQQPPRDSGDGAAPAAADAATYLIAYRDHSVYTALAYWVEGSTLHYVTTSNTHNQADLSLIDVEFTRKLNADRRLPFTLTR